MPSLTPLQLSRVRKAIIATAIIWPEVIANSVRLKMIKGSLSQGRGSEITRFKPLQLMIFASSPVPRVGAMTPRNFEKATATAAMDPV